jgi:SagB-type dehydrogenase family enzyme
MTRQTSAAKFRRSPHLVSFWRGRFLFVRNYATDRECIVPPSATQQLDFFAEWRTLSEFAARSGLPVSAAKRAIARLLGEGLLHASDRRRAPRERAMDRWTTWNPAAGFFHSATRDNLYIEPLAGDRLLRAKAKTVPVPARVKRYPRSRSQALPQVRATGEFPQVLLARRTWRQFSKRPVTVDALATLLGLTGGIHEWAAVPGQAELPLKTSPSGGSRHPIEIYVCARRVEGITAGLYHYAGDTHRLELLRARRAVASVRRYLPTQFWYEDAAAVVFFSALYERYQWKYSDARAYRATLIEAGHQCQTFCLVATWLGLAPFCTMALADSEIEEDLGLDGVSESVIYAAGVGVRPPGGEIRSKPKGFPQSRVRLNARVVAP